MRTYWERQNLAMRQIRFRFKEQRIKEADTPTKLEDTINVFQEQKGA